MGKAGLDLRLALEEEYDLVVEMDSDLSHLPEELPSLLGAARDFDLVIGSRYVPGGGVTHWGVLRRLLYPMDDLEATEFLVDKLRACKNNAEFFESMRKG